jgi:2-methylisocitrate lyase-like PEP mutase family enzyme
MGFKLAIYPGLLFKAALFACDEALQGLKDEKTHPTPGKNMTVRQAFNRFGAEEWDRRRTEFRDPPVAKAAE